MIESVKSLRLLQFQKYGFQFVTFVGKEILRTQDEKGRARISMVFRSEGIKDEHKSKAQHRSRFHPCNAFS